jgi:four helix bundle protein
MKLEELRIYQTSMLIGERVWEIVEPWSFFAKDTVGKQWVRAVDSIAANISEGYGRYHFKENRNFLFYARGSLHETATWLQKAHKRSLLSESAYQELRTELENLAPQLNGYIRSIGSKNGQAREPEAEYGSFSGDSGFLVDFPNVASDPFNDQ